MTYATTDEPMVAEIGKPTDGETANDMAWYAGKPMPTRTEARKVKPDVRCGHIPPAVVAGATTDGELRCGWCGCGLKIACNVGDPAWYECHECGMEYPMGNTPTAAADIVCRINAALTGVRR